MKADSLKGAVLASVAEMYDPHFHRTLVYVAEHNAGGALGFVMNRPLGKLLREVATSPDLPKLWHVVPVLHGGPVRAEGVLLARFRRGANDEELLCQIAADPAELAEALEEGDWVRAFVGYAGWTEGQLEQELGQGAWKVCAPHPVLLDRPAAPALWAAFMGTDQRWRELLDLLPGAGGEN